MPQTADGQGVLRGTISDGTRIIVFIVFCGLICNNLRDGGHVTIVSTDTLLGVVAETALGACAARVRVSLPQLIKGPTRNRVGL